MWKEIYKKYLQLVQQSGDRRPSDEFYLKKKIKTKCRQTRRLQQ
jgi:hypothetical protein